MFEPLRPMMRSKLTAPDAIFAIASSEELYVATWTFALNFCWNFLTVAGST